MARLERVLRYLARDSDRVAISNGRLLSLNDSRLRFRFRNSKNNNCIETMTLDAVEFPRCFLLHVLPRGFVFLAHRRRSVGLARCRELLQAPATRQDSTVLLSNGQRRVAVRCCPLCRQGRLRIVA